MLENHCLCWFYCLIDLVKYRIFTDVLCMFGINVRCKATVKIWHFAFTRVMDGNRGTVRVRVRCSVRVGACFKLSVHIMVQVMIRDRTGISVGYDDIRVRLQLRSA